MACNNTFFAIALETRDRGFMPRQLPNWPRPSQVIQPPATFMHLYSGNLQA